LTTFGRAVFKIFAMEPAGVGFFWPTVYSSVVLFKFVSSYSVCDTISQWTYRSIECRIFTDETI